MNSLTLNPVTNDGRADERSLAIPALTNDSEASGSRRTSAIRVVRRRLGVSRLRDYDSGFRPFRIY